jgi:tetratricopeptide (TPR) repeat protein
LVDLQRYDEALVHIDSAIEVQPESGIFYALKGKVLFKTKLYGECVMSLTRAIELDGDKSGENHIIRAMVYKELGLKEWACRDFQEGLARGAYVPPDSKLELLL